MSKKIPLQKRITKPALRAKVDSILARLSSEATPFPEDAAAQRERKTRAATDHFYFFRTYLPHYFPNDPAPFHYDVVDLLNKRPGPDDVLTPVAIAAPREFAKSTITSFGYALHQACFKQRHFIILGSDTSDLAADLVTYLMLELCNNPRIKQDFGEMADPNDSPFDFTTKNDVRFLARGRGQRIRGLKHKQHRPDLVILDDLENDQNVQNPRLVKSLLKWITETVYPGVSATGNLFIIGTILARKSALNIIVKGEQEPFDSWTRRLYRAIQSDGTSLWPARYSVEKLLQQKKMMGSVAFNKEKQNNPTDEESSFREEWVRYYTRDMIAGKPLVVAGGLDPSSTKTGDPKALVIVGLDRAAMDYYVLHAWIRRASPDAMIEAAYRLCELFRVLRLAVEENALKDFLHAALQAAAQRKGHYLPVHAIQNSNQKEARIVAGLSYLMEHGHLFFLKDDSDQNELVEQLLFLDQPSVPDDGADGLEMGVRELKTMGGIEYRSTGVQRTHTAMGGFM